MKTIVKETTETVYALSAAALREALGLEQGDWLLFLDEDGGVLGKRVPVEYIDVVHIERATVKGGGA